MYTEYSMSYDNKKLIEALEKAKKALELLAQSKIQEAARQVDELKKKVENDSNQ
jgi:hypothetical protein